MERQVITVDIAPGNSQVERLGSSQGDIGRPMGVYIIQNGVALDCSAYSAELYILKPDGKFYTTQATVDATEKNLIKWETALQETPVAGACAAQIRITAGDDDIGTARFVEFVEASPGDMGSASESEVALLTEYVRQARESATSAGIDATTASDAASSASGSASTASAAASTATQAASTATDAAERAEEVEESIPADYSQLSGDVSGLKSAFEQLDANVITESAGPAPIVSIADGADGMPMRKVEVAIEPVQDLHGYEYPWPAGGGKNLLEVTATTDTINGVTFTVNEDGTVLVNGTATADIAFIVGTWVSTGETVVLNGCPIGGSTSTYRLFADHIGTDTGAGLTKTPEAGQNCSVKVSIYNGTTANNLLYKPMIRLATETDATFAPYSNICPISGWTGAKVTRTGKNLLPTAGYTDITRNALNSSMCAEIAKIVVGKSDVFVISGKTTAVQSDRNMINFYFDYTDGTNTMAVIYRGDQHSQGAVDGAWSVASIAGKTISTVRVGGNTGSAMVTLSELQLEIGSTATSYEPYQGQTYEVTFPADPGTVYGGTLDVATGKLVVDRSMVDLDTLAWTMTDAENHIFKTTGLPDHKPVAGINYICSVYKSVSSANNAASMPDKSCKGHQSGGTFFYVKDTAYSDVGSMKNALSGAQLVYELGTTLIYSLTPTEIKTLLGINNVWADAGNTSITYPADTKTYIDRKITEAVANALNA